MKEQDPPIHGTSSAFHFPQHKWNVEDQGCMQLARNFGTREEDTDSSISYCGFKHVFPLVLLTEVTVQEMI